MLIGCIGFAAFPHLFWWGIGSFYFGMVVLLCDLYFEKLRRIFKIGIAAVLIGVSSAIAFSVVFVSAPLTILVQFSGNGIVMDGSPPGIEWKSSYSEILIRIQNNSASNYDDVNLVIKPEQMVAGASIFRTNSSGVILEPDTTLSVMSGAKPGVPNFVLLATDCGYRIRCDRIPKDGGFILIAMALVEDKDAIFRKAKSAGEHAFPFRADDGKRSYIVIFGEKDADIFGPPPVLFDYLDAQGSYVASMRERKVADRVYITQQSSEKMTQTK